MKNTFSLRLEPTGSAPESRQRRRDRVWRTRSAGDRGLDLKRPLTALLWSTPIKTFLKHDDLGLIPSDFSIAEGRAIWVFTRTSVMGLALGFEEKGKWVTTPVCFPRKWEGRRDQHCHLRLPFDIFFPCLFFFRIYTKILVGKSKIEMTKPIQNLVRQKKNSALIPPPIFSPFCIHLSVSLYIIYLCFFYR